MSVLHFSIRLTASNIQSLQFLFHFHSLSNFLLTFPQFLCKLLLVLHVSCSYSLSNISQSEGLSSSKPIKSVVFLSFYFFILVEVFLFFNVFSSSTDEESWDSQETSEAYLSSMMRSHETHRKLLKHTCPPSWAKRFNQNRNTKKIRAFIRTFSCVIREFSCDFVAWMWPNEYYIENMLHATCYKNEYVHSCSM